MPVWVIIYISFFTLMLLVNCIYLLSSGSKTLIILYEITETILLVYLTASYWLPFLQKFHGYWMLPAYAAVIGIDVYLSVWGDLRELGIKLPEEADETDWSAATAFSLLFSAPLYITSGLVCLNYIAG